VIFYIKYFTNFEKVENSVLNKSEKLGQVKEVSILGVQDHFDSFRNTKTTNIHRCLMAKLILEVKGCSSQSNPFCVSHLLA
jgi:hypothetical protein